MAIQPIEKHDNMDFFVSEPLTTPPASFETPLQQLVYETFAAGKSG